MFKVTHAFAEKTFNQLNNQMFDGLLDMSAITLEVDPLDTEWGYCVNEDDGEIYLGITDEFPTLQLFKAVMAHEMIHLFQIDSGWKVGHDHVFERFATWAQNNLILGVQAVY